MYGILLLTRSSSNFVPMKCLIWLCTKTWTCPLFGTVKYYQNTKWHQANTEAGTWQIDKQSKVNTNTGIYSYKTNKWILEKTFVVPLLRGNLVLRKTLKSWQFWCSTVLKNEISQERDHHLTDNKTNHNLAIFGSVTETLGYTCDLQMAQHLGMVVAKNVLLKWKSIISPSFDHWLK